MYSQTKKNSPGLYEHISVNALFIILLKSDTTMLVGKALNILMPMYKKLEERLRDWTLRSFVFYFRL